MCELDEKLKFLNQNAVNILKKMCFKNDFAKTLFLIRRLMPFFLMNIETTVMCLTEKRLMSFYFIINIIIKLNWLMKEFSYKTKFTYCQVINFRKWKSILLKTLKDFIEFSKVLYFMLILFTLKVNGNFWFCINYQKFNIIIKHNCYFISLINEMFI